MKAKHSTNGAKASMTDSVTRPQSLISVLELLQEEMQREKGRTIAERMQLSSTISGAVRAVHKTGATSQISRSALEAVISLATGWQCFEPSCGEILARQARVTSP